MAKLYNEQIDIQTNNSNIPKRFIWRRRFFEVVSCRVIEDIPDFSEWWRPIKPTIYRCTTKQNIVCDLVKESDGWLLTRVWD